MAEPVIAKRSPYVLTETHGERFWCACGRSKGQPYCDDSHEGTGIEPVQVMIDKVHKVAWCGCKHTKTPPYCDGSHSKVPPPPDAFRPKQA
jgi:CDGSH-type Zn-finger protein